MRSAMLMLIVLRKRLRKEAICLLEYADSTSKTLVKSQSERSNHALDRREAALPVAPEVQ